MSRTAEIYKITATSGKCYIAYTTTPLSFRLANFKHEYKLYKQGKPHSKSTLWALWDEGPDWTLQVLETMKFDQTMVLRRHVGSIVKNNSQCVNKIIPGRTDKEYYQDNKDKYKLRDAEKYRQQRSKLLAETTAWRKAKKDDMTLNSMQDVTNFIDNMIPEINPEGVISTPSRVLRNVVESMFGSL